MNLWTLLATVTSILKGGSESPAAGTPADVGLPAAARNRRPFTILVEGNVGSGKSTLLRDLDQLEGFAVVPEPVKLWQNVSGTNLLNEMINDGERWLTTFQLYSLNTRLNNTLSQGLDAKYRVMERSIYSQQYVFTQIMKEREGLTEGEYALLKKWFDFLLSYSELDLGVDLIIYVKADTDVLEKRIAERGRKEEVGHVGRSFLADVTRHHDAWLIDHVHPVPAPVLVVDGNKDVGSVMREALVGLHDLIPGITFKYKKPHRQ